MKKLEKHRDFLLRCSANPSVVKSASLSEIACLVEILYNLSSIPFTGQEKKFLCKHLDSIRSIAKCSRENTAREQLVQQGGAILPVILPAVLALANLLA